MQFEHWLYAKPFSNEALWRNQSSQAVGEVDVSKWFQYEPTVINTMTEIKIPLEHKLYEDRKFSNPQN